MAPRSLPTPPLALPANHTAAIWLRRQEIKGWLRIEHRLKRSLLWVNDRIAVVYDRLVELEERP